MYEYHYVVIWNNATTWVISGMVILPLGLTLSAIKRPKIIQLMRSKIQNCNLYVGNIFKDLEF